MAWRSGDVLDSQQERFVLTATSGRGFSLIELMVTVAVMVLLALLAAPSMVQYTEASKIQGSAELFYAATQQARMEAIRRNAAVDLILTDQAPVPASADTTSLTTSGPNWLIRQVPASSDDTFQFIEGKSGAEGGGRGDGGTLVMTGSASSVQFNALGSAVGALTVNFSSSRATCAPTGAARCLRVVVSPGGQARLCDPVVTAASDNRKC